MKRYEPWYHFLVTDDESLLFRTGLRGMHAEIREAVSNLINLSELCHISFSHFESDECGALNEWLSAAPKADAVCSQVGGLVSVNDFTGRELCPLADGGTFATGKYRFRYCHTPHCPTAGTPAYSSKKHREDCFVEAEHLRRKFHFLVA